MNLRDPFRPMPSSFREAFRVGRTVVAFPPRHSESSQRGLTLVETLAALVVLSVGLLGIAALQIHAMDTGRTAFFRGRAVDLSADMAERIRSNPLALDAYAGPGADHNCTPVSATSVGCTPAQMAAHDLFLWDRDVHSNLPNAEWRIQIDAASAAPGYRLELVWGEPGRGQLVHQLDFRVLQR